MFKNGCRLLIFACNTASSDALRKIQREYLPKHHLGKKVLGVLIPAAEAGVSKTKNGRIGVIATEGTVRSGAFVREIKKLDPTIRVLQRACPLLVPIVESGEENSRAAKLIIEEYLKSLKKNVDTLILGCTHYGILRREIKRVVGVKVRVVSESDVVPGKLKEYLERHPEIEKRLGKRGTVRFYSTDLTDGFIRLGSKFFGKKIKVRRVIMR